jgi:2,4-dienoyl-CoA reductase-like NADH-dependent reductase (Old Yellow Enzyme family)
MATSTTSFFSSIDISSLSSKNRLAVAPRSRVTATDCGHATGTMSRYYQRFARGGFNEFACASSVMPG